MWAFSSPGLQRSPKALWKLNEKSLNLCVECSLAIPKRSVQGHPPLAAGHVAKVLITSFLFAALFCVRLKQIGFFLLLWKSHKRGIERWKKQPEETREGKTTRERKKETERQREKGERNSCLSQPSREWVMCCLPFSIKRLCGKGEDDR